MRSLRFTVLLLTSTLLMIFAHSMSVGQLSKQRQALQTALEDLESIERIVNELNQTDSAYVTSFPVWEVTDPDLRQRIYTAFRNRGIDYSPAEKIWVVANYDSINIISIRIGKSVYGKIFAQTLLARDLRQDMFVEARQQVQPRGIREIENTSSNPVARPNRPDWISLDLSLFGTSLRFGNDWEIIGRIGEDELGYPFWTTGQFRMLVGYKGIRLGAWLPINAGLEPPKAGVQTLGSSTRLLNGSDGLVGEFEFESNYLKITSPYIPYASIGGMFAIGSLSPRRDELLAGNLDSLYHLTAIAQGYYSSDFLFDQGRQNFNFRLGALYSRISQGKGVVIDGQMVISKGGPNNDFIDPYVRVEYRNHRGDKFRFSAQYSRMLMFTGWAEVISPFLYVELRYSSVVGRATNLWEHDSYIFGTLGFTFDF